jgi:hypothetical protein
MGADSSERWQLRLLPLMRAALVLMAVFFFVASLLQYRQVYRDIGVQPGSALQELAKQPDKAAPPGSEAYRFRTLVALEQDVVALRYRQANAVLLLRTWTRYTGFLVGMVLALTGAFFILGRLREDSTHLVAEGGGAKLDLTTQSPGMLLAVLGTALMVVTVSVKFDSVMTDKPTYVAPWGLEHPGVGFKEIPEETAKIISSSEDDRPLPPK